MKQTDETLLQELNNKMLNKVPFAFSRWGDGEWGCLKNVNDVDCDGNIYYKDLSERLKKIASVTQPYYMGHQHGAPTLNNHSLAIDKETYPQTWVNSDIWHDLSMERGMKEIFDILDKVHVVFVGNESLSTLPFINEFIEIPNKNVWLQYNDVLDKIKSKIKPNEHKIFLLAAGRAANVFIDDLWAYNNENTFIAASSAFDPYIGRKTRGYHHRLTNIYKIYK